MKTFFRNLPLLKQLLESHETLRRVHELLAEDYVRRHRDANPKYDIPGRLTKFEYQVYSQDGQDGILDEIFTRIGTTNRFFVETGVGDGLENNTTFLLLQGWRGAWIEANPSYTAAIKAKFSFLLDQNQLFLKEAFVNTENINSLLEELKVPEAIDLLSLDIDGNDYWIWKAIERVKPRVLVIEYNATFRDKVRWVMKYNPQHAWGTTSYQGASLKSLEHLGDQKGYHLVGCDFIGLNAFFVRKDLVGDKFLRPFTSENHYESPKYYHLIRKPGNKRDFGPFEMV